jgi:hypothetical protein
MVDTPFPALKLQAEALRRLSPAERLQLAFDMSLAARALLRARLREEHQDWTEPRIDQEVLRLTLLSRGPHPAVP